MAGDGPEFGWVSLRMKGRELLRLAADDPTAKKEKVGPFARLVTWPKGFPEPMPLAFGRFEHVCVFGAHHTGTNAMIRDIQRFFRVNVKNVHRGDNPSNPELWKHSVLNHTNRNSFGPNTFCICLVKDPAFWIQSLARRPQDGTFYDIRPAVETPQGVEFTVPSSTSQLFSRLYFNGQLYSDALELWEATVSAYFDEEIFPLAQTAVVRCEDHLFDLPCVIRALAACGLPWQAEPTNDIEHLESSAKDYTHPGCTRRGHQERLHEYSDPKRRFMGLSQEQISRIRGINSLLLGRLHYGADAVASWSSRAGAPEVA